MGNKENKELKNGISFGQQTVTAVIQALKVTGQYLSKAGYVYADVCISIQGATAFADTVLTVVEHANIGVAVLSIVLNRFQSNCAQYLNQKLSNMDDLLKTRQSKSQFDVFLNQKKVEFMNQIAFEKQKLEEEIENNNFEDIDYIQIIGGYIRFLLILVKDLIETECKLIENAILKTEKAIKDSFWPEILGYTATVVCAIGVGAMVICGGWAVLQTWGGIIGLASWISVGATAFYKSVKIRQKVNKLKEKIEELKIYQKKIKGLKEEFDKSVLQIPAVTNTGYSNYINDLMNLLNREETENEKSIQKQSKDIEIYNDQCPLCLQKYQNKDELTIYDCKHGFHTACIEKGLKSQYSKLKTECPTCRTNVVKFSSLKQVKFNDKKD